MSSDQASNPEQQPDAGKLKPEFQIPTTRRKKQRNTDKSSGDVLSFEAFSKKRKKNPANPLKPVDLDTFLAMHQPDLYQREQDAKQSAAERLQEAKQKYITNYVAESLQNDHIPGVSKVSLTEAEQEALAGLSDDQRSQLNREAMEIYWERRKNADAQLLERYMTQYLLRFRPPVVPVDAGQARGDEIRKHQYIRESFTEAELKQLDNMYAPEAWQRIATKPEILKLINRETSLLVDYAAFSEAELMREAEFAARRIYAAARDGAIAIAAPSGGGKSRLIARKICFTNAIQKVGSVTIDCVGGAIDNALQKISEIHDADTRREVISRLRYVNTAGMQIGSDVYVTAWPMLAQRYEQESLHTRTQRIVQLIATTDKALAEASIQGMNRLAPLLTSVATILAALDLPLSLAFSLLSDPASWRQRVTALAEQVPEAGEAAAELLAFYELNPRQQEERSEVLRNKLAFLKHNSVKRAIHSAPVQSTTWPEVAEQGLQVYLDLRDEPSPQSLELSLMWIWQSIMEYVRSRGATRTQPEFMVIIDELSYFVRSQQLNAEFISEEFREFVQVRRRNAGVSLVAATQERLELPETLQSAFKQLPSQLMGATTSLETALENAKRWIKKAPTRMLSSGRLYLLQIRKFSTIRGTLLEERTLSPLEEIVDETPPQYMDYSTQDIENAVYWLELPKGEWLFAMSPGEGELAHGVEHITTAKLDNRQWVKESEIAKLRKILQLRDGVSVAKTLRSIQPQVPAVPAENEQTVLPELDGNTQPDDAHNDHQSATPQHFVIRRKRTELS